MTDRSATARDVSRSVIVTGDGNSVSLVFGDSGVSLPLRRQQVRPPERRRPLAPGERRELDLLDPARAAVPLVGRAALLDELAAWLAEESDLSVRALTGRAGSGKTRLAIELCRRIDPAPAVGDWAAGFLPASELRPVVDWERPTLLVIDYAGQAHAELARWLDRLAFQTIATKLRFLLLEREAPEGFGWWKELTGPGLNAAAARRDLFHDPGLRPVALPGLEALEDRRRVMSEALTAAAGLNGTGPAQAVPVKRHPPLRAKATPSVTKCGVTGAAPGRAR